MPQHEPSPVPPNPDDVLAYWRWYYEVVQWPKAPKMFQGFWRSIESCEMLQLLCEPGVYEPLWLHALLSHLGDMWQGAKYKIKPQTQRTGKRGRPPHLRSPEPMEDPLLSLCILDLVVMGLLGSTGTKGRPTKHWKVSADLLQHFFPEKYPPTGWDRLNLKGRVNKHLREHRPMVLEGFNRTLERSAYLTSEEYRQRIQAHLSRYPTP